MSGDRKELDPIRDLARALAEQCDLPTRMNQDRPRAGHVGKDLHTIAGNGCWCGLPHGHKWRGSDDGAPHPRDDA